MDRREQRRQEEELLRQRRQQQLAALEAQRAQAAITGTTVGVPQIQSPIVSQVPAQPAQPESERAAFIRRSTLQSNAENVYDIMQNYAPRDQVYTRDQINRSTVWCADGSMNCELPKDRFGLTLTGDQIINIGSSQISQTGGNLMMSSPQMIQLNSQVGIPGRNTLEFGTGVSGKEKSAGKIGYGTFDNGASLALVGAGSRSGSRNVRVWDNLVVSQDQTVNRNAAVVGDLSFTGVNGWTIHTPDDTRRQLIIAPRTADNKGWNWSKQMTLDNGGNLSLNGNLRATGSLCLGTSGTTCLTESNVRALLALIKK
jgi:hypothetical protein